MPYRTHPTTTGSKGLVNDLEFLATISLPKKICDLRNELFHETLWDGSQPCTAVNTDAFMCAYHLRRFNQRLIPALLGYNNEYVKTEWWSLSSFLFGEFRR